VSTVTVSAETENKFEILPNALWAMHAGSIAKSKELLDVMKASLNQITHEQLWSDPLEALREGPKIYKERMAESYCRSRLAISYDRLLKSGKDELDPALRRRSLMKIYDLATEVQLIVCGFDTKRNPRVFKFDWDEFSECTQFACIGSGASAADHSLYRRGQSPYTPIPLSIYHVFEAKKFGELSPAVGVKTKAALLGPDWCLDDETASLPHFRIIDEDAGMAFLNRLYSRYGPRNIKISDVVFPDEMFR
jgi:hypothetical protein